MRRLSWPSRRETEDGFTLIEVLVAMGVMFSALVVLAYTMMSGLSAVGFSRQRTEATALANQALEQIRALPSSQLYLSATDIASDTQLATCASSTCFKTRIVPIADFGSSPTASPLLPHVTNVTALPGNTSYTVKSYVTFDVGATSGPIFIATVQVSWSASQKNGIASSLQVESKIYNNQFNDAPPGIHTFAANAQGIPGGITITGTILGLPVGNVAFNLPGTQAAMSGNSIGTTNVGTGGSAGAVSADIAQSGITVGPTKVLNTPDASASAQSASQTMPDRHGPTTATPTAVVLPGSGVFSVASLAGTFSAGSTSSASAVAASAADSSAATPGQGNMTGNQLGFGQAAGSQSGVVGANLNILGLLGATVASLGLVSLTPTGNLGPDLSTVEQKGSSQAPNQQTFFATANQQLAQLDILTLSTVLTGASSPLISLTGFAAKAYACAGPVACTTPPPVDTGTIIIGGQTLKIQDLLNNVVPPATLQTLANGLNGLNLPLGVATVSVSGVNIALQPNAVGGANAQSQSVGSPLVINLDVNVSIAALSLLSLHISVNLGSVSATASYS